MAPPEIAVVVHAYERRAYLPHALRSIAAQTVDRDRVELLVVTSFDDPAIERTVRDLGGVLLHDEDRWNSRCLHRAVRASRAPVVTFLDDDDEYEPERLERVLATFRQYPDLGFYRNRVRVIDGAGRPIPPDRWREHEKDVGLDRSGPVYVPPAGKGSLLEVGTRTTVSTFNTGTMAIRRELLDGDVGEAFDEARISADTFLFLAGALSPYGLFLDDRRLTRFRFYGANTTRATFWLGMTADALASMSRLAARHGRPDFATWYDGESRHYRRMFLGSTLVDRIADGASRSEVARLTGGYLRFLGRNAAERAIALEVWAAGGYGLAYAVAPAATRRLAKTRPTAWKANAGAAA